VKLVKWYASNLAHKPFHRTDKSKSNISPVESAGVQTT
jgi:hypothetical protein